MPTGQSSGILIPEALLKLFDNKVRITDIGRTQGIRPIDINRIKKLSPYLEKIARNKRISSEFDLVVVGTGVNVKADLGKIGLTAEVPRIKKFRLIGIPIPDLKLKNLDVILTPKL